MRWLLLLVSHGVALAAGFALGVYLLPIITAPPGPDEATLAAVESRALYKTSFAEDLPGNDFAHWGRGEVVVSADMIAHRGELAPGPDYKLYLTPSFVEDEAGFEAVKAQSVNVGDVKSFDGFTVTLPAGVDLERYDTVVVWCEAFGEFIAAAKYR